MQCKSCNSTPHKRLRAWLRVVAGGDKLKKQKALVAKLRSSLESLEADASRRSVQAKTTAKAIDKAKKDIAKLGEAARAWRVAIRRHAFGMPAFWDGGCDAGCSLY